jgi:hypothetical protein
MKTSRRCRISHLLESQFEPGSRGRVLKNLLNIARKREMDVIEAELYALVQLDRDYEPMKKVFKTVLSSTRRTHAPR